MPVRLREEGGYFLEILALTAFAFAQPVLDVFGRSPETFVFRGAVPRDIVLFALIVCLVPPLVLGAIAALANAFGPGARRWAQTVVIGGLFTVLMLVVGKKVFDLGENTLVLFALVAGVGFAASYRYLDGVKTWLRYASVAPLVFTLLFLFVSPVSALLSIGEGASADVGRSDTPVVLLVLDEFPTSSIMGSDGSIDAELFPGFADLAADGTWYRNATTVSLRTFYAVPAILTGRYPRDTVVPVASTYPVNLFTFLGNSYDVDEGEALTRLCPTRVCGGSGDDSLGPLLEQTREVWTEMASPSGHETDPNETLIEEPAGGHATEAAKDPRFDFNDTISSTTPARFEEFIADIDGGDGPSLDFLHLLLPHSPFQYYPSGMQYDDAGAPIGRGRGVDDIWTTDEGIVRLLRQRHLLQSQYVDRLVSRMTERLRDEGIYDQALVIVTADHGVAFEPGESSRGGDKNTVQPSWAGMAYVPLFIKAPAQSEGAVSDANVTTVDILPSVADHLGVDLPWDVDGRSVLGDPRRSDTKIIHTSNARDGAERPGARHEVDGDDGSAAVRAAGVDTLRAPGDPQWAPYRIGPFPEIVGRPVTDFAVVDQPVGPVHLTGPERFDDAEPAEGHVPGVVFGKLDEGIEPGAPVACAVNGTIGGVSPRFTDSRSDFGMLPPDWLWRDGENDVTCYLVRAPAGTVELVPLQS